MPSTTEPVTAPIFDVQRFSIHDGPGIRTLVFFNGCPLKCAWCQNPESQHPAPLISFYRDRCRGTLECQKVCTDDAINPEGYRVNHDLCTYCLKCVDACSYDALQPIGERMTPEHLLEKLLADLPYYRSSGGGVTFSGGEPTLYPAFMDRVLDLCAGHQIHTTLETCGNFSHDRWRDILPKLDLIYFDLKIIDDAGHQRATGSGNRRILDNARKLVDDGHAVEFRLTLVPGHTDDPDNLRAVVEVLKSLGHDQLHLLGYHNMGETKIDIIDGAQPKLGLGRYSPEKLAQKAKWFENQGIRPRLT